MAHVLLQIAQYSAIAFLTYVVLLLGYRLTLHPLSHYPGPLCAKLSDAYAGFYAGSMSLHVQIYEDHLKHGPIIRYGPNRLIFNSVKALRDIYLNERVSKSHVYRHIPVTPGRYSVFDVTDKATHRFKRKLIGQAISERSMRIFQPTMMEEINTFLRILAFESTVNMTEALKRLGMDIVGRLAFGYPLNTQTVPENRFLISAHMFGTFRSNMFLQFPLVKKAGIYSFLERLATADVRRYFTTVERILAWRVAQEKDVRHDLYSLVADQMNPDRQTSMDSEIWAEAAFFFPAGGETTATLLSAAFFYLSRNPSAYKKLAEEIRSVFHSSSDIEAGPKLSGCRYLRACIDETLRISPPISGTLWRELSDTDKSGSQAQEPLVVDGHVIPRGVQVGVNMYALHHNEQYFPEPLAFIPERWVDESQGSEGQRKLMQDAFVPFSLGARNCAGKAMAYQQASLVLAKTFWYFDFEVAPGKAGEVGAGNSGLRSGRRRKEEFQLYEIISATHDGPNLMFHSRGDSWRELVDSQASP